MDSVHRRRGHGRDVKTTLDDTAILSDADAVVVLFLDRRNWLSVILTLALSPRRPHRRPYAVQDLLSSRFRVWLFVTDGTMLGKACSRISDGNKLVQGQILTMKCRVSTRHEPLGIHVIVLDVILKVVACMAVEGIRG